MDVGEASRLKDGIVSWLAGSDIVSDDGAVYSWANPEKPGYIYSEIMGYYIKLFSYLFKKTGDESHLENARRTADRLASQLSEHGAATREGIEYAFDSAMCISGLLALSRTGTLDEKQEETLRKLAGFVYDSIKAKAAAFKDGKPLVDEDRWSLSYGTLLIKACMPLYELYEHYGDEKYKTLAESVSDELISLTFKGDHFTINGSRDWVYTHPHCYATEGLIFLKEKGYDFSEQIRKSAEWLASNQNDDGSMSGWYLRDGAEKTKQGDATAQAARIWLCVDKERYENNIKPALAFLKSLQGVSGGLAYNKSGKKVSDDVNSWVSTFAVQALLWYLESPDKDWII